MTRRNMNSKEMESNGLILLSSDQLLQTTAGSGPLGEALEWYYKTMGSFYRGLWDGLTGQEPKV